MKIKPKYECIVIGVSAGGTKVLEKMLPLFPADFAIPIVIVQHLHPNQEGYFIQYFNKMSKLTVKDADEKEHITAGHVYFAPPNYHLLIEANRTFSLNIDEKVNFARPSIDVCFDCAAQVYNSRLVGVILTGANSDGAKGLLHIKQRNGLAIVQDPYLAEVPSMPKAAIKTVNVDYILDVVKIVELLISLQNS